MFGLQELFDKYLKEQFKPNKLGVRILESELETIGINLSDEQRTDLEKQFEKIDRGSLSFNFNDEQLTEANVSSEEELKPKIQSIVDNLGKSIERFSGELDGMMEGLVLSVVNSIGKSMKDSLAERMEDMLEDQEAIHANFGESIEETWGEALDLLQGLIVISDEAAQGYLKRSDQYSANDVVQDVLLRIHAKSNQISKEILVLLRHGFADGAQARWRSLHELAVVSSFIAHHGEDVAIKYIEHEAVEVFKAAKQYNEYYVRLGAEEISKEEMAAIEEDYVKLVEKYGTYYGYDYGWASNALNLKKPTFKDIEADVELDHIRPYYKAASANIHANPVGVLSSLGLFPEEDILLAGPSGIGLSNAGQLTAITLTQITTSVLTYNTNIDFLVVCQAMAEYSKDVERVFIRIENEVRKHGKA
ncbi:hypothetical protein B1C78_16195 [Thioalkalivibrio denitrificans]|uniref:Uncharacterized protein n=1 Tax=Thioalkalivibrio denitrificans TaxID=108003 RepID=A0A1V3N9H9_9GAMM|nr:DUF5677 domain-containing protein [Thioalkalivibrio denitrificans]OOG21456.1 hypothetical protein B1C78_16195 [Thioalkalivibrio denitrificans]